MPGIHRAEAGRTCVYCAEEVLTGNEKPEHVVPAAIRGGLAVFTVCDLCNGWAGKEVDQPFLDDDFIRLLRAEHDVRDPRRRDRRVPNPLGRGFTDDGIAITVDENWVPQMQGRIVEDADSGDIQVVATDAEEYRKLTGRVIRRAQEQGKQVTMGDPQEIERQPRITGRLEVRPWVWRREMAKIALACAAEVYPEDWRTSEDARRLRHWMRDPKALPSDHCPVQKAEDTALVRLAQPPSHTLFFHRNAKDTILCVMLFGDIVFKLPVDTADRPLPSMAWHLETTKPSSPGQTTFDQLTMGVAIRAASDAASSSTTEDDQP